MYECNMEQLYFFCVRVQLSETASFIHTKDQVTNILGNQRAFRKRSGKIAAQCGHAVLGAYHVARQQQNHWLDQWESFGAMKLALKVSSEETQFEHFEPPKCTC